MGLLDRFRGRGEDGEHSTGGQPIFRHRQARDLGEPVEPDPQLQLLREQHLTSILGEEHTLLQEIVSVGIDLGVYVFPPDDRSPCWTLVTDGMSDLPMTMPQGTEDSAHLELLIGLPPDWPGLDDVVGNIARGPLGDERNYWPIRLLKDLARLPHELDTFLGRGHSVPNGEPAEPYAPGVPFTGALVGPPLGYPEAIMTLETPDATVSYLAVLPITDDEMELKLASPDGGDAIFDRMTVAGVTTVVDLDRASVVDA